MSNTALAYTNISLSQPPLLAQPSVGSVLSGSTPQSVYLSWTPRHQQLGASLGVYYTLSLYEIPEGEDLESVVNSGLPPHHTVVSAVPFYWYGVQDPPLTKGKRYGWQVRAQSLDGTLSFGNEGYSNIGSFRYGRLACANPVGMRSALGGNGELLLRWEGVVEASGYELRYGLVGSGQMQTVELASGETSYELTQLEGGVGYEWRVESVCGLEARGGWTATQLVNVPLAEPADDGDGEIYYNDNEEPWEKEKREQAEAKSGNNTDDTSDSSSGSSADNGGQTASDAKEQAEPTAEDKAMTGLFDEPITLLLPSKTDSTQTVGYTVLPEQPTVEQLQTALKKLPPNCAGIAASYVCGNHDNTPRYSGEIISVSAGDEIAMNSMVLTVINIDGEGNGTGLIKIPMMNNLKFGLKLEGIKVAKGGCIVAGKAALSGVSVQLLNDELRGKLQTAYATYNKVIEIGIANAGDIAKTINATTEAIDKLAAKITEKKRNTRALLATYTPDKEKMLVQNCTDIANDSKALQDSLESIIGLVKAGKLKADLKKLQAACAANVAFMNKLAPALADCQGLPAPALRDEARCKGPCANPWELLLPTIVKACGEVMVAVFGVEAETLTNYLVSINIQEEPWLNADGKTFQKVYVDCSKTETKDWSKFVVKYNFVGGGEIFPFVPNGTLPNETSFEASKLKLPMAGEWGNNLFSMGTVPIDDYTFFGRVLEFCPNLTAELKTPWPKWYNGAKAKAKTVNFAANVKTISDITFALVDGWYVCKDVAKAIRLGWKAGGKATAELVGKYDWSLVKRYFQHIQEVTSRAVGQKQIDKLKDALRAKEYTKLSPSDYVNHSKKFTTLKKEALIKQWEKETGDFWPVVKKGEEVYSKNGTLLRKAGDKYDAHHIIEQNYGGEHEWWNIHPAKYPDEHQAGIHGSGSPSRELFK